LRDFAYFAFLREFTGFWYNWLVLWVLGYVWYFGNILVFFWEICGVWGWYNTEFVVFLGIVIGLCRVFGSFAGIFEFFGVSALLAVVVCRSSCFCDYVCFGLVWICAVGFVVL